METPLKTAKIPVFGPLIFVAQVLHEPGDFAGAEEFSLKTVSALHVHWQAVYNQPYVLCGRGSLDV